jgi:uncharacterized protein
MRQYIYTLRLIPKFWDMTKWTEAESQIVNEHFVRLQEMQKTGSLILAGKTDREDEQGFGVVIFKAKSDAEAEEIMQNDPCVKKEIMTAILNKYLVALISENNIQNEL